MGYHVVNMDSLEPRPEHESERRTLQTALDLEHIGLSVYTAEPGEQIPIEYHYHDVQEELLYVLDGRMHVETPSGERTVEENEVFVAEPESPHRAFNEASSEETLRVIAVGGPMVKDGHYYEPSQDQ
jgi:mannose-6-phosphate isomerase-like protein (cupin superfamily)